MKILHINDRLSNRGGADIHMTSIIRCQATDHKVHLAVGRDDGNINLPCNKIVLPGLDDRSRRTLDMDSFFDEVKPDITHVHNVMNPMVIEWAAGNHSVMTIQDHRLFCPGRGKWTLDGQSCSRKFGVETCATCFTDLEYFTEILKLTNERLNAIRSMELVVLSDYMRTELESVGIRAENINVIPPFVADFPEPQVAEGYPCILFSGRLVRGKGVYDAVEAWRQSSIDLPLVFAGTGSERENLENLGFTVLGWLPRNRLMAWYRNAKALIMAPRWQEPFGIAGLEAMTIGVPVVSWESGGISEWHPGPLAPWGNIGELARILKNYDKVSRSPMKSCDQNNLMSRLFDVYESTIEGNH